MRCIDKLIERKNYLAVQPSYRDFFLSINSEQVERVSYRRACYI